MDVSIIIPVRNDLPNLEKCVTALSQSTRTPFEIIIVDDASDAPLALPAFGVRTIRLERQSGPAAARNAGACQAAGDILVFLDADVFVQPDTLEKTMRYFEEKNEQAVVGVFEDYRGYGSFYSDYKNLWMKYSYENCQSRAALFYTSFAAIRAEVFAASGGFDASYTRPSTEDTAFGNLLWDMGVKPLMVPDVMVFHNKEYSLLTLLKTDFIRAGDLVKLKLRKRMGKLFEPNRTSVDNGTFLAVGIMILAPPVLLSGRVGITLLLICLSTFCNRRYLAWLTRKRGSGFAAKAALFLGLDTLVAGLGLGYGLLQFAAGRKY